MQTVLPDLVTAWHQGRSGPAPSSPLPAAVPQPPPAPQVDLAFAAEVFATQQLGGGRPVVSPTPIVANNVLPVGHSNNGGGKGKPSNQKVFCHLQLRMVSHCRVPWVHIAADTPDLT